MGPKVVLDKKIDLLTLQIEQTCGRFRVQYLTSKFALSRKNKLVCSVCFLPIYSSAPGSGREMATFPSSNSSKILRAASCPEKSSISLCTL